MTRTVKPDISSVVSEYLCHSCGACLVSCNHDSIRYAETTGGYLFPTIDYDTCTNCGNCHDICPGRQFEGKLDAPDYFLGNILSCHVGRATRSELFENAQSGGIATALLTHLFETGQIKGAVVATMQTAVPPRGGALLVRSAEELLSHQKSKYVPIHLLAALATPKRLQGPVALVGLPCHIHGLINLFDLYPSLKKKVAFKIGLVCDRVMTAAAIDFFCATATSEPVRQFVFRDKQKPRYPGNPVAETVHGKQVVLNASLRVAMKDFFTPARCRLCFDKLNVFSDIVLGDPHGLKGVDRTRGETMVLTRTERGRSLLEGARESGAIAVRTADPLAAAQGQGIEKKRVEWARYSAGWMALGKTPPIYAIQPAPVADSAPQQAWLLHALSLDSFSCRNELLRKARRWRLRQRLFGAVRKAKRRLKRMLAGKDNAD